MGLFGKTPTPQEQVRAWRTKLRAEDRAIDRQIRSIRTEEAKVQRSIKTAAKKGDMATSRILARELVRSRKAVSKMYTSKAQINSVQLSMQHQLAMLNMSQSLQKSTEVMHAMNALVRVPEVQATMRELAREMMKAGLIEELVEDSMSAMDGEDLDEAADEEIEKVIMEITAGTLLSAGPAATHEPGEAEAAAAASEMTAEEQEELASRLDALRE